MIIGHGARPWAAYPALSAPLTMMGVERRWFLLSRHDRHGDVERDQLDAHRRGDGGFASCTPGRWWAWRTDPHMLTHLLRESVRFKTRYDPAKWADQPWYLVITPARRLPRS